MYALFVCCLPAFYLVCVVLFVFVTRALLFFTVFCLSIVLVVKIYISTNYANTNVDLKNILSTRVFQLVCDLFFYIVIIIVACFWKEILIAEGERILEAI